MLPRNNFSKILTSMFKKIPRKKVIWTAGIIISLTIALFIFGKYADVFQLRGGCSKRELALAPADSITHDMLYCRQVSLFDLWSGKTF